MIEDFDRCYRAMLSKDARFDGQITVGVHSTGIYCRPSCPVHPPKPENVRFYPTAAAAQQAGLRACRRCRPDASPGSPAWNTRADIVARAMRLIGDGVVDREGVSGLAQRLAFTERQLHRLVVAELGAGPLRLARMQRAQNARTLIETTTLPISDVAFAAGFGSVRQLNDTIRAVFATTPSELRRRPNPHAHTESGRLRLHLAVRTPFSPGHLLAYLTTRAVPGVEHIDGLRLYRTLRLPRGTGSVALQLHHTHVDAELQLSDLRDLQAAVQRCRHLLDLDADPEAVSAELAADLTLGPLVSRTPGLRSPGGIDATEILVRAIVGQQVSLAAARRVLGRLAVAYGEPYTGKHAGLTHLFPSAERLAAANPADLPMPRARADTLIRVMAAVADDALPLDHAADRTDTYARLVEQKGIGPWTASYVLMRGLGDPDVLMAGDLGLTHALTALQTPHDHPILNQISRRWSPWRSYATHHIWYSLQPPRTSPAVVSQQPASA
jgi:AraC family transcriptional regulator of adaptative response / DNA-3-methyladenine glycosylase II